METATRTTITGEVNTYLLTREKGFFTSHIWVYLNGKPYLHLMPTKTGTARMFKNCDEYGYLSMGELMADFEDITLNDLIGF